MSYFLSKVKSSAKSLVGSRQRRCKFQFCIDATLASMPVGIDSGGLRPNSNIVISLSRGAKAACTQPLASWPNRGKVRSDSSTAGSGGMAALDDDGGGGSSAGDNVRRLEFISTLMLGESCFEAKPFKLRIKEVCPDSTQTLVGSANLDVATLVKIGEGGQPLDSSFSPPRANAVTTHSVSVPIRNALGVSGTVELSLCVSSRWINRHDAKGGSTGGAEQHSEEGSDGLSDFDQMEGDVGIDDIAMTNVGKHRIQTKSGNLNSTLVHMDSDGIPASPPSTTKPVAAGYGAHPALPQSSDAAAMNVRHIQDLRIMQQALRESEDRYRELAVRVPLVRSQPATPDKSHPTSVGGHAAAVSTPSFSFQPPSTSTGLGHGDDGEAGSPDELFRLREKVMNLEAEVERLTEVLEAQGKAELARDAKGAKRRMEEEHRRLRNEVKAAKTAIEDERGRTETAQLEAKSLREEAERAKVECKRLMSECERLEKGFDAAEAKVGRLTAEGALQRADLERRKREHDEALGDIECMVDELRAEARGREKKLEKRVMELEGDLEGARVENEGARGKVRVLQGKAKDLEARLERAEGAKREMEGRLEVAEELKGRVKELEGRLVREIEGRGEDFKAQEVGVGADIEGRCESAEAQAREALKQLRDAQRSFDAEQAELQRTFDDRMQMTRRAFDDEKAGLVKALDDAKHRVDEVEKACDALKEEAAEGRELESRLREAQRELEGARKALWEGDGERDGLRGRACGAEAQAKEWESRVGDLLRELEVMREEMMTGNQRSEGVGNEGGKVNSGEGVCSASAVSELGGKLADEAGRAARLSVEAASLRERSQGLEVEAASLRERSQGLERELREAQGKLQEAKRQVDSAQGRADEEREGRIAAESACTEGRCELEAEREQRRMAEERVGGMEGECEDARRKVGVLKARVHELEVSNASLAAEYEKKKASEAEKAREGLEGVQELAQGLQAALSSAEQALEESQREMRLLEQALEESQREMRLVVDSVRGLAGDVGGAVGSLHEAEVEWGQVIREVARLQQEVKGEKERGRGLEGQLDGERVSVARLRCEVRVARGALDGAREGEEAIGKCLSGLASQLDSVMGTLNLKLQVSCETLIAELEGERGRVVHAVAERDALLASLRVKDSTIASLQGDKDAAVSERDALFADVELLGSERDALLADKKLLGDERDALLADKKLLGDERDALLADKKLLGDERDALLQERDSLAAVNSEVMSKRDEKDSEGGRLDAEMLREQIALAKHGSSDGSGHVSPEQLVAWLEGAAHQKDADDSKIVRLEIELIRCREAASAAGRKAAAASAARRHAESKVVSSEGVDTSIDRGEGSPAKGQDAYAAAAVFGGVKREVSIEESELALMRQVSADKSEEAMSLARRLKETERGFEEARRELEECKRELEAKRALPPPRPERSSAPSQQQVDEEAQERAIQLQEALQRKLLKTEATVGEYKAQVTRLEAVNSDLLDKMARQQLQQWDKVEDRLSESQNEVVSQLIEARLLHAEVEGENIEMKHEVLRLKSVVQVLKEKLTSMELRMHKQGAGQSEEKKQGRGLFGMRRALGLGGGASKGEVSAQKKANAVDDSVAGTAEDDDVMAGDGDAGTNGDGRQV